MQLTMTCLQTKNTYIIVLKMKKKRPQLFVFYVIFRVIYLEY